MPEDYAKYFTCINVFNRHNALKDGQRFYHLHLQIRTWAEVKQFIQGCTADWWQNWDLWLRGPLPVSSLHITGLLPRMQKGSSHCIGNVLMKGMNDLGILQ